MDRLLTHARVKGISEDNVRPDWMRIDFEVPNIVINYPESTSLDAFEVVKGLRGYFSVEKEAFRALDYNIGDIIVLEVTTHDEEPGKVD